LCGVPLLNEGTNATVFLDSCNCNINALIDGDHQMQALRLNLALETISVRSPNAQFSGLPAQDT
jgi:hypothetical protein